MFKKGFDYYFDIAYILLLFLCFLFFMPYLVLALLIHLKIDFYSSKHSKTFDEVFSFYIMLFLRNNLEVNFALIYLWFLYLNIDCFILSRKKVAKISASQ